VVMERMKGMMDWDFAREAGEGVSVGEGGE
jgi:hypothetical protein